MPQRGNMRVKISRARRVQVREDALANGELAEYASSSGR